MAKILFKSGVIITIPAKEFTVTSKEGALVEVEGEECTNNRPLYINLSEVAAIFADKNK